MATTKRINSYADVLTFARMQLQGAAGSNFSANDQLELARILCAASRSIDAECRRYFYSQPKVRYFNGNGMRTLDLAEDCVSVSEVAVSTGANLAYDHVLAGDGVSDTTDFFLMSPDEDDPFAGPPYTMLRTHWETGSLAAWVRLFRSVRVTGVWGYSADTVAVLDASGTPITATLADATTTALTLSGTPVPPVAIGNTLVVGSEQMFVRGGSGTSLIVSRGVNGTTAAAHAAVVANLVAYADVVVEATIKQTARLWARRQTPMFPHFIMQGPGAGVERLSQGLDPDISAILRDVRKARDLV